MDLSLTPLNETSRIITFGWMPIPCAGYVFYVNNKRVSNTWNTLMSQVTFQKVPNAKYKVEALGIIATGEYPPPVPTNSEKYSEDTYGSFAYSK